MECARCLTLFFMCCDDLVVVVVVTKFINITSSEIQYTDCSIWLSHLWWNSMSTNLWWLRITPISTGPTGMSVISEQAEVIFNFFKQRERSMDEWASKNNKMDDCEAIRRQKRNESVIFGNMRSKEKQYAHHLTKCDKVECSSKLKCYDSQLLK